MKLKEGMYVRTKDGEIKKIFQYNEQENNPMWCTLNCYATFKGIFSKASNNIIDLIEVGDYVNGYKVYNYLDKLVLSEPFTELHTYIDKIEIKSIVTKEQMASMEYKVGE